MTVTLDLAPADEPALRDVAAAQHKTVEQLLTEMAAGVAAFRKSWTAVTAPIADEFSRSGTSDDELAEFLEEEKHVMRTERNSNRHCL